MITTLIFDFNGVLSKDNTEIVFHKFKNIINASSLYSKMIASRQLYECMTGKISYSDFKRAIATLGDIDVDSMDVISEEMMNTRVLNVEVLNIIKLAKTSGKQTILHSDYMKVPFDYWVRKFKLRDYFDNLLCSSYIGSLKSNPETWEKVLKVLNKKPEECVLIDDLSSNVYTAESKGMHGIVFRDSEQLLKELEKLGIIL